MAGQEQHLAQPYQGILYVERQVLADLSRLTNPPHPPEGPILSASFDRDRLHLRWWNGTETAVSWPMIRMKSGLYYLPAPRLAFLSDWRTVGLLFSSRAPLRGLHYVEPRSKVSAVGLLTANGFEAAYRRTAEAN